MQVIYYMQRIENNGQIRGINLWFIYRGRILFVSRLHYYESIK